MLGGMDSSVAAVLISGGVSLLVSGLAAAVGFRRLADERRRYEDERRRYEDERRPAMAAEQTIEGLLSTEEWKQRSFDAIKHRVGKGFKDDELQRMLLSAGAVRFTNAEGDERWGLVSRNQEALKRG